MHIYILTLNIVFNFDKKRRVFGEYRAQRKIHMYIRMYVYLKMIVLLQIYNIRRPLWLLVQKWPNQECQK